MTRFRWSTGGKLSERHWSSYLLRGRARGGSFQLLWRPTERSICQRRTWWASTSQWRNILTGGPWTNYIKGPIPHFEFTEEFIIINVLTKITIKHKAMMKCEVKSNFIIKAKLSV